MENKEVEDKKDFNISHWSHRPGFVAGILIAVIGLILLVGTFAVGSAVAHRGGLLRRGAVGGYAMMSGRNGGNISGRSGMGMHARGGHLLGSISAINGSTITIHNSSADTSVAIQSSTSFYKAGQVAKQSDLKVGDVVSVRGLPDSNGIIQAKVVDIR